MNIIIVFAIVFILMLVAIIKFKVNCGVALFGAAILAGLLSGMAVGDLTTNLASGFGNTMTSIGLILLFGGGIGSLLAYSGAMEEMAKGLLRKVGKKHDLLALNIAGMLISIPILFGPGYIMLSPLLNSIQKITKKRMTSYATATYVGLIVTHSLVAPTPGPVAVAGATGANLGWFMLYALIVAIPTSLIAGWLFGNFQNRKSALAKEAAKAEQKAAAQELVNDSELLKPDPTKPSAGKALVLLLLPVVMLILGSVIPMIAGDTWFGNVFKFIGNSNVALFISMLIVGLVLRKSLVSAMGQPVMKLIDKSADSIGSILFLLGAAGSFALVLSKAGLGDALLAALQSWNLPILLMGFLLAFAIRLGVGSAMVAMITTVSIVWPLASSLGYSPIIVSLAICSGAMAPLIPTDVTFWFPEKYNGLTTKETFSTVVVGNLLAGVVAFGLTLVLNVLDGVLPGLH
ncbi:MAG TPA: SLC13 family permease [Eubacteriales bacterium]|nr:SLC13 family permease [Clostridia bacterium]HRV73614.1 SLC13 family permease [Eubacteriales bacterium]